MRKNITALISFLILIITMIFLILVFKPESSEKDKDKIQIVATLFPQYDFAKQIVKDRAEVTLLVGSGVETHNFEPTAQDMVKMLDDTDMFLYTGTFLEPWTEDIIDMLEESNCKIIDVSKNVELIKIEEFEKRYINEEIDQEEHNHEEENEEHIHNDSCNHQDMYDGHIWQSLDNANIMIGNILNAICQADPENSDYYKENAREYQEEIQKLDTEIEQLVKNSKGKEIAVVGEFAYAYFVEQYNLNFVSVYSNCGHGEDPSIAKVKTVIDYINKNKMPAVYYEELSEGTVAKMIAEETVAEALVLYSIHNGNPKEDTYVSLMRKNIDSLKKGLK